MDTTRKPPATANQNTQQYLGRERDTELAGNYGGGPLADNESGREADRQTGNDFRLPLGSKQTDQFGGDRAERGAALQRGANTGERDGGNQQSELTGDEQIRPRRPTGATQDEGGNRQ